MSTIKSLSRLGAVLASLAVIAVSFASSALASTSMYPQPGSEGGTGPVTPAPVTPAPVTEIHTVVVGGMPGWQIALIAVVAALVTAIAAVLVERGRTARRTVRPLAQPISGPGL
jgi:hypothetical protein